MVFAQATFPLQIVAEIMSGVLTLPSMFHLEVYYGVFAA